jgi:hypothetical protein
MYSGVKLGLQQLWHVHVWGAAESTVFLVFWRPGAQAHGNLERAYQGQHLLPVSSPAHGSPESTQK